MNFSSNGRHRNLLDGNNGHRVTFQQRLPPRSCPSISHTPHRTLAAWSSVRPGSPCSPAAPQSHPSRGRTRLHNMAPTAVCSTDQVLQCPRPRSGFALFGLLDMLCPQRRIIHRLCRNPLPLRRPSSSTQPLPILVRQRRPQQHQHQRLHPQQQHPQQQQPQQ